MWNSPSLDLYKHKCNKPCSRLAAKGPIEVGGKKYVGYARLYCKGWSCPYCGPRKAAELRKQITKRAIEFDLSRFLTLTLDPKVEISPDIAHIKYIREVWRKFRVYLKRKFGERVSFISVLELQKNGMPHLHVLVDRYIRQAWISEKWERLGGGKIVFIEKAEDLSKMGWYLSKYLTKDLILSAPTSVRRYSCSQNIKLREPREETGWTLAKYSMETLYRAAEPWTVEEKTDGNENIKNFMVPKEIMDVTGAGFEDSGTEENETGVSWNRVLSTYVFPAKNKGMRAFRFLPSIAC